MKRVLLVTLCTAAVLAVGGAALAVADQPVTAPDVSSEMAAFRDICITPASHGEIRRKARATGWTVLGRDALPAQLAEDGVLRLQEARQGTIAGRPVLLTVGNLSGTSECKLYIQPADTALTVARLKAEPVLGQPLGAPDFDAALTRPDGWKAIGWHRSTKAGWRAVHYSFDIDGQGPGSDWQSIEITRKI
ncbi:hypothetical protein [Caulobacter endophyticus]|uniref:Uncharacterized protein n=1 Tax=Caulobacter endophyticus TaxID=2172652 RepID=A0A2T9KBP4_9CAUL|nr:hypothetical protein [Caulobacter endophyticus]PVM93283.1 hypothetical protein DDF67_03910 [Caulobacter endophyticus]